MYSVETLGAHGTKAVGALPSLRKLVGDKAFGGFGFTVGQKTRSAIRNIESQTKATEEQRSKSKR
jgi:hypothetical protein